MSALGAAIGVFVWLGLGHAPAWAQADQAVSNDGTGLSQARAASGTVSPSNDGRGRELAAGEVDDALANIKSRAETAEEVWALWAARPMTAPKGIETIIGPDQRTRVNPTTSFPARATVLITFNTSQGGARCTGWMINRNTVATAGHCVARGGSRTFYNRASYKMYPGRNGGVSPYGSCTAKRLYSVLGWLNNGSEEYDYGAIKLNCNIGNTVGWYGYFWTPATLVNKPAITQGYPGDKPLTQWRSADKVRANTARQVFYMADTIGGQSGSPVWYTRTGCGKCSMAIHAYGLHGSPPHSNNNHGTRINQAVFNNLTNWKNAP